MKKSKLLFAIMLIVTSMGIIAISCNKEKNEESSNIIEKTTGNESNMDEYLTAFKEKLLSTEKGNETINQELAIHDLANLLNFDFGDANYPSDQYLYDTIHAKLVLTNDGEVLLSQLAVTYNTLVEAVISSYRNITLPDKSILYISCHFNEAGSSDSESADLDVVVCYRGFVGTRTGIHDTLDWRPGNRAGTCDGQYIGQYGGPEIQTQWIGQSFSPVECLNGGRLYFTEEMSYVKVGVDTYDNSNDKYKIYASYSNRQDTICISHEEMEYYFANILAYWGNETPSNYTIMDVFKVRCIQILPGTAYYLDHERYYGWYTWYVYLHLGKPNCTETDPLI